jgi:lipopolysaccharide export system permease protein
MPILDRYIIREVGSIFLFGIALFTLILTVNHIFFLARFAATDQVGLAVVARLLLLRVPYFLAFSLPMALLLGVLLTFGRLSDRNEVVAMRTSGISLIRVAIPVLAGGVFVSLAGIALNEWVVPLAEERYRTEFLQAGSRSLAPQGYLLFREREDTRVSVYYARSVAPDGESMEGLTANQFEGDRLVRVIEAARARYGPDGWKLEDGTIHLFGGPQLVQVRFQRIDAGIRRTPREILVGRKDPSEMTIAELRAYMGVLRRTGESIAQYLVWLHSRLALPTSSLIFALLAVPLGLRPHRSGPSIGLGLTIVTLLVYYLLMNTTLALGQSGQIPPSLAAWSPNLLIGTVGGYLLWRAR